MVLSVLTSMESWSHALMYRILFVFLPFAVGALIILGLGAWCYFSQLRLAPVACVLGGLAAALNSCFFSVACWGLAAQAINAGMFFFAMAALANPAAPRP